ncbi:DUF502 domain-containing protein [Bacillota bacterium LX-D]|nr:DUF502 domain-containing protein [Bacillota bacterium LX-D]
MKKLFRHLLSGLALVVPFFLTIYIAYLVFKIGDAAFGNLLRRFLPIYIPGLGFILLVIFLIIVGFLGNRIIIKALFNFIDKIFSKLPLLGMVYQTIKTTIQNILGEKKALDNPVYISLGMGKIIGFKTNEIVLNGEKLAVVYVPLSLQMAGHLVYIPLDLVHPCELPSEEVFQLILSAGISR